MGSGMSNAPLPPPTVVDPAVSIARLHGLACFHCGAVSRPLRAAGTVVVRGGTSVWPVVTCGCLQDQRRVSGRKKSPATAHRPRGMADCKEPT